MWAASGQAPCKARPAPTRAERAVVPQQLGLPTRPPQEEGGPGSRAPLWGWQWFRTKNRSLPIACQPGLQALSVPATDPRLGEAELGLGAFPLLTPCERSHGSAGASSLLFMDAEAECHVLQPEGCSVLTSGVGCAPTCRNPQPRPRDLGMLYTLPGPTALAAPALLPMAGRSLGSALPCPQSPILCCPWRPLSRGLEPRDRKSVV